MRQKNDHISSAEECEVCPTFEEGMVTEAAAVFVDLLAHGEFSAGDEDARMCEELAVEMKSVETTLYTRRSNSISKFYI